MMNIDQLMGIGRQVWLSLVVIPGLVLADNTIQRPISEFIDVQGTTNVFFPPVGDFVFWFSAANRPPVRDAYVDYAGLADKYIRTASNGQKSLGTTMTGSIIDRPLGD